MANEFKIKNGAIVSGSITGITESIQDNSTKMASTAWVKLQGYLSELPVATASILGAIKVGAGLAIDTNGVLSIPGVSSGTLRTVQTFTATAGQTTFTVSGGYSTGLLDVFLNGVLLTGSSVGASDGSTVVLTDAAEAGDIINVITYSPLNNGFINGTTDSLVEGTSNLYFTPTRVKTSISGTANRIAYNSTAGSFDLATIAGLSAGSYGSSTAVPVITVDSYGRVTAISTSSISGALTFTGDVTGTGTTGTSTTLTLANSGVTAGTYNNSATQVRPFTVDAKGRVTSIGTAVTITPAWSSITGTPTTLAGYGILDAYTKTEVDNLIQGLDPKQSVKAATTANITLSGTQTIDGIALVAGDRVLVKNQTTASANGIYVVAAGAWTRSTDANSAAELLSAFVFVEQGTTNADTAWVCSTDNITLETTSITFVQFAGTGAYQARLNGTGFVRMSGTTVSYISGSSSQFVKADGSLDSNTYLTGNQSISLSGDVTGSGTTSIAVTLANSGVTAGSYGSASAVPVITVDAKGRVTGVTTATISGALTFSGDVTGTGTTGTTTTLTLANSGATAGTYNNVTVNAKGLVTAGSNVAYLTGNQSITISGDASGTGTTAITLTLANSGVTAGTYNNVTVNAKGLVTAGSNAPYLVNNQTITLSGDATGSGSNAITVTLANSGVTAGTYRSVTVNAKGLVTAGTNPTTVSGYGITDILAQVISGFVVGANSTVTSTDTIETAIEKLQGQVNARLTANQSITLSGDATGSGTTAITVTLANSGVTAGTYTKVTVDAKGRVTSGTTLAAGDIPSLSYLPLSGGTLTGGLSGTTASFSSTLSTGGDISIAGGSIKLFSGQNVANQYRFIGTEYASGNGNNKAEIRFVIDGADTKTKITFHTANGIGQINEVMGVSATGQARLNNYTSSTAFSGTAVAVLAVDASGNLITQAVSAGGGTTLNGTGFVRMSGTTPSYITGTSSQFVKADGSLDSTTYAASSSLSSYLPLSGGTMTGALNMVSTQKITFAGFAGIEYWNGAVNWEGYVGTENNTGNLRYNSRLGTHTWYSNSTQTMQLTSGGNLLTRGATSTTVLWSAGANSATFGNILGSDTTYRSTYFRGSSSNVSVWWGGTDANGAQIPYAAIDATAGEFTFWRNSGGTGGGTWTQIMAMNASGLTINSGTAYIGSNAVWHAGNLTNLNQLTNGPGYITSSGSITGSAGSAPLLTALNNYVWSASSLPNTYNQGITSSFVSANEGFQNYGSVMTMRTYSGGGGSLQMFVPYSPTYGGNALQVRFGNYDVSTGNSWTSWKTILQSDNYNSYAPTLTGGGASGTWGISVTGNAGTATTLQTARTITIGSTGKTFNGSANVSWTLAEIGAQAAGSYLTAESDTLATVTGRGATTSTLVAFTGKATLGNRSSASFNGNVTGLTINNTAEIRSLGSENPPGLTWHYEGLATRHILMTSAGVINVVSPSNENSGVAVLAVNGNTVLHAGNYNSYSPTLTGGGASGTWGINVTGSSGSVSGVTESQIVYGGAGRASNSTSSMNDTNQKSGFHFFYNPTGAPYTEWWNWITVAGNSWQSSNNYEFQLAHDFHNDGFYVRRMTNGSVASWRKIVDSANYNDYAPTKTGGGASGTWGINVTGSAGSVAWTSVTGRPTAVSSFTNDSGYITSSSVGNGTLTLNVSGTGLSGSASFTANQSGNATFTVSSNATSANTASTIVARDGSGNFTAGSVTVTLLTETSSIRYKENVIDLSNPLEKVSKLRGVSYNRKGTSKTEIGVIAEEVVPVLPEVITHLEDGQIDSVAYGRFTALLIEAVKEQQKQLEEQKAQINELKELLNNK